jgi:putative heme-binding domain-containing protein
MESFRMSLLRLSRTSLFLAALVTIAIFPTSEAVAQKAKKEKPKGDADALLRPQPRPKRPDLPPSKLPLEFIKHERIALVGNSTAERMNLFGHFETMLHLRFADKELVVRNFARPADEVAIRQRSADYTNLDDPLYAFGPDTFLCFFGFNESFKGPDGVEQFKKDYEKFIDEYAAKYPRDNTGSKPRFVLISPIAFEPTGDPLLPDGKTENENLRLYTAAVKVVAEKRQLAFVHAFTETLREFKDKPGMQWTINGCHLNDRGDRFLAAVLEYGLFGNGASFEKTNCDTPNLRDAINDKSWVHQQDYRMLNGWYVYGGRRTYDTETFPREYIKIRSMAAVRDRRIWDLAQGKKVPDAPDDSQTGELVTPPTRFGAPQQKYSEAEQLRYLSPDEFIKTCTIPPGFEIKLFADENKFPELAKPVQMAFDNRGRLWVSCMPNYPQWKPGDSKPNDRLLILEDTDGDGKADKCTVFYDQLHCPTGFEFYNGGVLVMSQPRILWLKDTDGDDKADVVVSVLDGWATDDTHHRGGFEWSNGGLLHLLEGISTSTTLETPWGPHRSFGTGGAYVIDPRTWKIRQFALPGMYNMWCYHFDEWGQGFVGDGTTPNQAWDTPLSGAQFPGRRGLDFLFADKGERPNIGNERLISRHFPNDVQGQFIYASVITMNGMPRYTLHDDGAGYRGKRLMHSDGMPDDLIRSTDKHFRPADPHIGPDGALWFGDWANALIGHMQYSQRDPNRDHSRGRIYRLVAKDRPLLKPVTQYGKSIPELLEQLREYEWRTRYRARQELRDRPAADVLAAVKDWLVMLEKEEEGIAHIMSADISHARQREIARLRCEALWIQQSFHAVDVTLLKKVLAAPIFEAQAAAVRVLADERDRIPGAFDLFKKMAVDEHPRVRTEAVRALSFYPTAEAVDAILAAARKPMDYWTSYTVEAALGANEAVWRQPYLTGKLARDNPAAAKLMDDILAANKAGGAAAAHIKVLLDPATKSVEVKNKAMAELAKLKGNGNKGREVFVRNCIACHKVGNGEGQDYGPNLAQVATRSKTRMKLIESVIDPNAEVDKKYLSTRIDTVDMKTVIGLVISETKDEVVIFDGKEKKTVKVADIDQRQTLKQSSMPEGQVATMSAAEFLDLIEYLANLK